MKPYNVRIVLALTLIVGVMLGCDKQKSGTAPAEQHKEQTTAADKHEAHEKHKEGEHEGEEEEGHAEEGEAQAIHLSEQEMQEFNIKTAKAGPGRIDVYAELPGEIVPNADRVAHVVPRVPGIVRKVYANLGDIVKSGTPMAQLESRELADAKAIYLASKERLTLAEINFRREELLWKKKVTAEQDYLDARQAMAEARIEARSAEQKLHTFGFSEAYLEQLPSQSDQAFTRYDITAPFSGTVIEKHISLNESLKDDAVAFIVADLSTVWVDIQVYQKDLARIRKGQEVLITVGHDIPDVSGTISWVGPMVGEATRTALARVVLPNPDGVLRPGLFVTTKIAVESSPTSLQVAKSALQTIEERPVVFVQDADGFEPRPVKIGRESATEVEIVDGLSPGETYVSQGAFTLKAQLAKGAFGDGHNH
jgi:cobalt-zinc-cadmium efflux system membrane fusion protein